MNVGARELEPPTLSPLCTSILTWDAALAAWGPPPSPNEEGMLTGTRPPLCMKSRS
jgi:hypothetical protein